MVLKETCQAWTGWVGPPPFFHFLCNGGGREMWRCPELNTCHVWCNIDVYIYGRMEDEKLGDV